MTLHAYACVCVCVCVCECVCVCVCGSLSPGRRGKLNDSNQLDPIPFSFGIPPCIPHPLSNNKKQPLWLSLSNSIFCPYLDYNLHISFLVSSNFLIAFLSLCLSVSPSSSPSLPPPCLTSYLLPPPSWLLWTKAQSQIGLPFSVWPQDSFHKHSRVSLLQDWLLNAHTHTLRHTHTHMPKANYHTHVAGQRIDEGEQVCFLIYKLVSVHESDPGSESPASRAHLGPVCPPLFLIGSVPPSSSHASDTLARGGRVLQPGRRRDTPL